MYKSVKKWCKYPAKRIRSSGKNAAGEKLNDIIVDFKMYREDAFVNITRKDGTIVTSKITMYLDSAVDIIDTDTISVDGIEHEVIAALKLYDGKKEACDLQVIYL